MLWDINHRISNTMAQDFIVEHEVLPTEIDKQLRDSENSWSVRVVTRNPAGTWQSAGAGILRIEHKVLVSWHL